MTTVVCSLVFLFLFLSVIGCIRMIYLNQDKLNGFFFIFDGRFFLGLCNYIIGGGCNLIRQFERDENI